LRNTGHWYDVVDHNDLLNREVFYLGLCLTATIFAPMSNPTSTGAILAHSKIKKTASSKVSTAARELGRQGGLKGGPARAAALSDAERTKIARHAANVRWGNLNRLMLDR